MATLPQEFIQQTRQMMGEERFGRFLQAFDEAAPVSIRLNPLKSAHLTVCEGEAVPWCRHAFYLPQRPQYTMDPLLHAGCYYVQEPASMFLDEVLRQCLDRYQELAGPLRALDLCASPGGKSTLLRTALPEGSVLFSNEPLFSRATVLLENVTKWGYPNHIVTNCYPCDYRRARMRYDVILCDVPCSGEGMFRKDEATIRQWSQRQVGLCWHLQRQIVTDAWPCLRPGGIMIYSTCTFNTLENEENIRWLLSEFDAEVLTVDVRPEWNITGSLLPGFTEPVYRFIPGITRSEGLFVCVLRKPGTEGKTPRRAVKGKLSCNCPFDLHPMTDDTTADQRSLAEAPRRPRTALSYQQAISYLRGEALILPPDTPRGEVEVCFMGHPLGLVKNIGSRANNLYPKPWRIKTTHTPTEYEPVLKIAK